MLAEGLFLASRSAEQAAANDGKRARTTLRAYDIRSRSRTTPHGVFTGVAVAALTSRTTTLRLKQPHRTITTPSPAWLTAVAERLLAEEPALLTALTLTTTNLASRRGDRLEAEHPAQHGAELGSVRETEVSRWLMQTCTNGARADDVLAQLTDRYPTAKPADISRAVHDMIEAGLLLCDVLPADLRDDPLQHLLDRLPAGASASTNLERLRMLISEADAHPPGTSRRRALLTAARKQADALHLTSRPLTADTLVNAEIALPPSIGDSAALAASVLWSIGHRKPPLTDYHQRFRAAYGQHRLVPLLEVLDPVTGLGPPLLDDAMGADEELGAARTAALAALLSDALCTQAHEIALQDHHLEQLAHDSALPPPRTAEIHIQLLNGPGQDLRIAVCPGTGSQDAGAAFGRWARWLPALTPAEPHDDGTGPMIAEIVCRTRTAAPGALATETKAAPWRIPLGVPTRPGDLLPEDLAVTTAGEHLLLWSTRNHRPVAPVLYSRIAPRLLPPAGRALYLLGHAGTRPWHPWNWGPLSSFPFTPRVRYRNILLAPARWQVPAALAVTAGNRQSFAGELETWCRQARPTPPDTVVAAESDRHLPLLLRDPDQREVLRRSIHRGTRTLLEPLGPPETLGVLPGPNGERHLVELVVALNRRRAPRAPATPRRALRAPYTGRHLPGSSWLSAALPGPTDLHDAALHELAPLLQRIAAEAGVHRWFWLRYTTPALGAHVRLRFHGDPATLTSCVQPQLAHAVARLRRRGLCRSMHLEPYDQEIERYGGPQAISAAERLFCADSHLALLALSHTEDERLLIAAVSAADIAATLAPDQPRLALSPGRLTSAERRHRDILRPAVRQGASTPLPRSLTTAHEERHDTLVAYRDTLPPQAVAQCAFDVIHMHANRVLAVDPGRERLARTLAADLLHRP
ncbi:lantibiotic dehydratase [Streptomyces sp. TRM 70351]|uniref:lantibiotic dehydratase n=1 Tax=Streptomyces sp. TRM 70351 TaxID=3116552 RepID=UPI002E7BC230|nr:lantibiotic dehydratase [Streptomyces sp. TRM 70351]MEE1927390.1 lantibiotic dehydratase [Streptomyces sp. TRM 70351]